MSKSRYIYRCKRYKSSIEKETTYHSSVNKVISKIKKISTSSDDEKILESARKQILRSSARSPIIVLIDANNVFTIKKFIVE